MSNKTIENTWMFLGATYGASVRDVNRELLTEYRLAVGEMQFSVNPPEQEIKHGIINQVSDILRCNDFSREDLLTLPWALRRIELPRVATHLLAFTDDCCNKHPDEFFDSDGVFMFLNGVKQRAVDLGRQLNVVDQYRLALSLTDNHPIAASLLAHISLRAVARQADTGFSEDLQFPVKDLGDGGISMVGVATNVADFAGYDVVVDPLGNSYHFWAQFNAGFIFTIEKESKPLGSALYKMLFYYAPEITTLIRRNIGGKVQQFGEHAFVDRQGHRVGCSVAHFITNRLEDMQSECYH